MEYAIVEISGKQLWVESGKYYDLNFIPDIYTDNIFLNRVLLTNIKGKILIGKPYLNNVKIESRIISHFKEKKKTVFKMRPKKKLERNKATDKF